jgi:hypothetical protein
LASATGRTRVRDRPRTGVIRPAYRRSCRPASRSDGSRFRSLGRGRESDLVDGAQRPFQPVRPASRGARRRPRRGWSSWPCGTHRSTYSPRSGHGGSARVSCRCGGTCRRGSVTGSSTSLIPTSSWGIGRTSQGLSRPVTSLGPPPSQTVPFPIGSLTRQWPSPRRVHRVVPSSSSPQDPACSTRTSPPT